MSSAVNTEWDSMTDSLPSAVREGAVVVLGGLHTLRRRA